MVVMTVEEFDSNYLKLKEDTIKAINQLKDLTGKDIVFRLIKSDEASTFFKLKVKLARKIMDNHIVIINQDNITDKNELNYYIVHEIVHGLRLFNSDASLRKVLKTRSDKTIEFEDMLMREIEFKLRARGMSDSDIYNYGSFLGRNFMQLLFNAAVDARIELYIYNNYPSIVKLQKQAQKKYAKEILNSFDKSKTELIPEWILSRVNAMNYCYLMHITPIIGKSWFSKGDSYEDDNFKCLIDELMKDLKCEDKGQLTDIETIKRWVGLLGVSEYVYFDDFENIDFRYLITN